MCNSKRLFHQHIIRQVNTYSYVLVSTLFVISCATDYPALVGPKPAVITAPSSSTACPCTTLPGSSTSSPASATTSQPAQTVAFDTLKVPAPHFSPEGGTFYMNTQVRLTADTLPAGAVIEYSTDNGTSWVAGQQFTLTSGGSILTRIRAGNKLSINRSALFNLYFQRMLIIGNSIMNHGPAPELGWFNNNGMAASAPEKDFVHLLTGQLRAFYPPMTVTLQSGGDFERQFGTTTYSLDEFKEVLQQTKPDLILVRIGENIDQEQVVKRDFEKRFRQLVDYLANYGQPVRLVFTTSVWNRPQSDTVVRRVAIEKGHGLVDLSCMVGQSQYLARQYTDSGVADHPNDAGMQRIADLIWAKIY